LGTRAAARSGPVPIASAKGKQLPATSKFEKAATGAAWWQTGVIYQIYPRSFQDTDGDGIGDLNGIASRLSHLVELGVDAIWLSPIFPSPMADFGYDVTDFCGVDPIFGTIDDFDRLLAQAHGAGLKLMLDFVPNHTSDQHPWFLESRSSRSSAKRDWYIWRDPKPDGAPPNNWLSEFGGSAWTLDEATGQYYYHAYLDAQPDLNWRHPEVRTAMLDVLRFWFSRGVDGFRVDAIHHLLEDQQLRDNPVNPDWHEGMSPARRLIRLHTMDQPEVHDAIAAMRRVADEFGDRLLIGEAYLPIDRLMSYYGVDLTGFHLPFNFHLISTPWKPEAVAHLIRDYEAALPPGGWPNWVLGNHDRSRVASRIGREQARVAAMLLLTLRGTPTIYQGEEIGMQDAPIGPEQVRDPWERNVPGLGLGRDPVRTPMPWSADTHGGFTTGKPWLPVDMSGTADVRRQRTDQASSLSLYQRLLRLRKAEPALSRGSYVEVWHNHSVLVYERQHDSRRLQIALNMSAHTQALPPGLPAGRTLLSSALIELADGAAWHSDRLRPHEGLIREIQSL
jgi:alpha-glucosidase